MRIADIAARLTRRYNRRKMAVFQLIEAEMPDLLKELEPKWEKWPSLPAPDPASAGEPP